MSKPKTKTCRKKTRAVTTRKPDRTPIQTTTVGVKLPIEAWPTDTAPFRAFPLPAGRTIRIGYRMVYRDGSKGPNNELPYNPMGRAELRVTVDEYLRLEKFEIWAIPYGHAALHDPINKDRAFGRMEYRFRDPQKTDTEVTTSTRILDSVVGYIVQEMNRNKVAGVITDCRELNAEAANLEAQAAGLMAGTIPGGTLLAVPLLELARAKRVKALAKFWMVESTGSAWDYKTHTGPIWGERNRLGDSDDVWFYDLWSNIHFGYVGHAAGFSLETLHKGSDVQNFWDHYRADDTADKGSTAEGYRLYREGRDVTVSDILGVLERNRDWREGARGGG